MSARKPPPSRIYIERWPDGDDDQVHYAPTGYGVSLRTGESSQIYEYRRVTRAEQAAERKKRKSAGAAK